jgi:translocation and assembly module TamB
MTEKLLTNNPVAEDEKPMEKKPSLLRKLLRVLTHLSLGMIALIVLILILLWGVLFTNPGLRSTLWVVEKFVPEFSVERVDGALLTDLQLYGVNYVNPDIFVDLKAEKLELDIQLRCIAKAELCIETIGIVGANFALADIAPSDAESDEEQPTDSEPLTQIALPLGVGVKINRLYLDRIDLDILGNKIAWREFDTAAQMRFDHLTLAPTRLVGGRLTLAQSSSNESQDDNSAEVNDSNTPIELPEVWIPLSVMIQDLTVLDFQMVDQEVNINRASLAGSAEGHKVDVERFELSMPEVDLELSGETKLKEGYPLSIQASADIKQTLLASQSIALDAEGSVTDLVLSARLRKLMVADIDAQLKPLDPQLPFNIELTRGQVQWPFSGDADFKAQINRLHAKGILDEYSLDLVTAVQGQQIPNLDIAVSGLGSLEQVDLKSAKIKTLSGEVDGSVFVNWASPINWATDLTLDQIQPGTYWPEAEGNISGHLVSTGQLTEQGGWEVALSQLDIDGVVRNYPLNINGSLDAKDSTGKGDYSLVTPGVVIAHGQNKVQLSGVVDENWKLDTKLDIPKISHSIPKARGSILGRVQLRGPLKEPEVQLGLTANKIKWQKQLSIRKIAIDGKVTPMPAPKGQLNLVVDELIYLENRVAKSSFNFKGTGEDHRFDFNIDSDMVSGSLSAAGGLFDTPNPNWKGSLQSANFTTTQGSWSLVDRPQISYAVDEQVVMVQAHCWAQADSKVCLDKDMQAGQSGEVFASIQNFEFSQLQSLLPKETTIQGEVNATARAKWSADALPEVELSVVIPKGHVEQKLEKPVQLGWDAISANARLFNNDLTADWIIDLTSNGDFKGRVGLTNLTQGNQKIDAQLQLQEITLGFLEPLLSDFSDLNADINSDIRLQGPVLQPKVLGDFSIKNIVAQGDFIPVDVSSGELLLNFNGYQADLNAKIETEEGQLIIGGDGNWQDISAWHANLNLSADDFLIDVPPIVKAKVEPDIKVAVMPGIIDVEGEVKLPWARVTIDELPPSAISVSDDEVILDSTLNPTDQEVKLPFEIRSNLKILIGDDFRLSAFGLKGSLVGELAVTQKNNAPFILGEVNVVNGSYRSFGQDLLIDKGKVQFNGPADQPFLAITAIRNPENTEDDVIAGIRVTGPADEPTISVFSEPAMAQANALSYMLRGKDIDSDSGGDAMTSALIGLSLARSGRLVGEIGEAFGVTDLQLNTAGTGDDSQVTVSGYILPGLQVKYGVGIFQPIGEFTFRYRLMKRLYVEVVSGVESAVDLLYQFEFD